MTANNLPPVVQITLRNPAKPAGFFFAHYKAGLSPSQTTIYPPYYARSYRMKLVPTRDREGEFYLLLARCSSEGEVTRKVMQDVVAG